MVLWLHPILALLVQLGDLIITYFLNQFVSSHSIRVLFGRPLFFCHLTDINIYSSLKLHSADDDVIDGVVCIFKAVIFKPKLSGSSLTDSGEVDAMLPLLIHLLDERDGTARAVVMLIAEYCLMYFSSSIKFL